MPGIGKLCGFCFVGFRGRGKVLKVREQLRKRTEYELTTANQSLAEYTTLQERKKKKKRETTSISIILKVIDKISRETQPVPDRKSLKVNRERYSIRWVVADQRRVGKQLQHSSVVITRDATGANEGVRRCTTTLQHM